MAHQMYYIKGFIRYKNIAFTLNYSTDISLRCCKVSRALQLCSTAFLIISSVQFSCSVMSNSVTPWSAACPDSRSSTNSWSGDGQGGLVCCNSRGCKESDITEQLNWIELNWTGLLAYWIPTSLWWERQCCTTARPLTPYSISGRYLCYNSNWMLYFCTW